MKNFSTLRRNSHVLGFYKIIERDFIFFGTKHTDRETLKTLFPFLIFNELNQVHQATVLKIDKPQIETSTADGQWTTEENLALVIKTADCIPLMIRSDQGIGALHAGWRGVVAKIAKEALKADPFNKSKRFCFIGPHIGKDHFEVGKDVAETILQSDPLKEEECLWPHSDAEKAYVQLERVLINQLNSEGLCEVASVGLDTYSDPALFWSYRRDTVNGVDRSTIPPRRLFSFIARIADRDFPKLNL